VPVEQHRVEEDDRRLLLPDGWRRFVRGASYGCLLTMSDWEPLLPPCRDASRSFAGGMRDEGRVARRARPA